MRNILKIFAQKIGMDKSIAYSSGARIVQGVTGVGTVFFISTFLNGVEQGFYYTFGSILALQIFFELGLTGIMQQYVAHEASHLKLNKYKSYSGEHKYRSRLTSLVLFCLKWYSVLAILVFIFLMVAGFVYFTKYGDSQSHDVEWRFPWLLICIGTAIKLFQSPLTAIYRGLGYVKEMSKIGFIQQVIIPLCTWGGLVMGIKLYVIGIGYLLSVIIWQIYVMNNDLYAILKNLMKEEVIERVEYFKEIFPYQWRIALSWVSGYFIFQLFNPVLFATEGAVVAGQMGMTLQALNAIQSLSLSWMNTKVPLFSSLIALRDYIKLDKVFNKTLRQMSAVCCVMLVIFFVCIWILNISQFKMNGNVLADRFLGYLPLLLMIIPVLLQQYTGSWATYLRCHKKEPFLVNSVVGGILCMASTLGLGHRFGLYGITTGYCCIQILLCFWAYRIYINKKNEWHKI